MPRKRPDLAARNASRRDENAGFRVYPSEYAIWRGMIQRCHNQNAKDYPRYGARGVSVCDEWRASFDAFIADMGPRPANHSIDRLDNAGSYCKSNCAWRTASQQARNRRDNVLIEFKGETLTLSEWAQRTGICRVLIMHRLRAGWSTEEALTCAPSRSNNNRHERLRTTEQQRLKKHAASTITKPA